VTLAAAASLASEGWNALALGKWAEARRSFEESLAAGRTPEGWEGLAWACFWLLDVDELLRARAEAYRLYQRRGDVYGAARAAMWLANDHIDFRGNVSVASGWYGRARRLLADADPSPEHGWLALHEAFAAVVDGNETARARELGAMAAELGRKFVSPELEAVGMATEGLALVTEGRVAEGMPLLDEAVAAALSGSFRELWAIAWSSCFVIYACERVHDYDRAVQWCEEVEAVTRRVGVDFAWALCRAHHAAVLVWKGAWEQAECELSEAERELQRQRPPWLGEATVRLAELRRRQGRFAEAAALFGQAEGHPLALEGLAELALDQDDPARARRLAERLLRSVPPEARTQRAPALHLLTRANAPLGRTSEATHALAELEALASVVGTLPLRASASFCAGLLNAARGDYDAARRRFEDALDLYRRAGAPYEVARVRVELADVLTIVGAEIEAAEQRAASEEAFRRLGVERLPPASLRRVAAPARDGSRPLLTKREQEVLDLVARGMSDRRMGEVLRVSEHTVHRHVSNIFTKLGCSSRAAAVARGVTLGEIRSVTA
jgi:LuxR family transcriptional regulator, maltose regulon positive regulatory protein